jgi:hypothetical protein
MFILGKGQDPAGRCLKWTFVECNRQTAVFARFNAGCLPKPLQSNFGAYRRCKIGHSLDAGAYGWSPLLEVSLSRQRIAIYVHRVWLLRIVCVPSEVLIHGLKKFVETSGAVM